MPAHKLSSRTAKRSMTGARKNPVKAVPSVTVRMPPAFANRLMRATGEDEIGRAVEVALEDRVTRRSPLPERKRSDYELRPGIKDALKGKSVISGSAKDVIRYLEKTCGI